MRTTGSCALAVGFDTETLTIIVIGTRKYTGVFFELTRFRFN